MIRTIVFAFSLAAMFSHSATVARGGWKDEIPPDQGAVGLYQALVQLRTTATVLHVVAHPDDEDGAMLTYCARGLGAKTTLFSVTRGEGGANLISKHFFDELGILRTLEHEESAKYYGIDLRYSRAVDYGYSKTLDEAIRQWGGEETVLADLVREVRTSRPDVIVSRFRGDPRDGHGHHQFAGVMAQRVMEAAGDPKRFPELDLAPWKPQKLYANNIRPEWRAEDKNAWTVAVPTGEFNPVLGRSYAQIARHGLGFQRSQGISGHDGEAGESVSYYRLVRSTIPNYEPKREKTFFDGIDTTVAGLMRFAGDNPPDWLRPSLAEIDARIEDAWKAYDPKSPEAVVPALLEGMKLIDPLMTKVAHSDISHEGQSAIVNKLTDHSGRFQFAIWRALSINFDVSAEPAGNTWAALQEVPLPNGDIQNDIQRFRFRVKNEASPDSMDSFHSVNPGDAVCVKIRVVNRSNQPVRIATSMMNFDSQKSEALRRDLASPNVPVEQEFLVRIPHNIEPDRPYWNRPSIADSTYYWEKSTHAGYPFDWALCPRGVVCVELDGAPYGYSEAPQVRVNHPEYGDVSYPILVVPRVSVTFDRSHAILVNGQSEHRATVKVRNCANEPSAGVVKLTLPEGWQCDSNVQSFAIARGDEEASLTFTLRPPRGVAVEPQTIQAVALCAGREYREGFTTVTARDLGRANYYRPAQQTARVVDVKMPSDLNIGYVMGSGDEIPEALAQLGAAVTLLDAPALTDGDLQRFDTIMIGIRAYAVRQDLVAANPRLLEYVKQGGNLVVFYQTPEFDRNFGPYPYQMGRNPEEVSEEDATVALLQPEHPLFLHPNRIATADFADWLEQRGSKFWQSWDERYAPLLECHDHEQPAQTGGMLYASYGKGTYVYCAYALYRQLPQGVPGAYRLLANLAAHGKKDAATGQ